MPRAKSIGTANRKDIPAHICRDPGSAIAEKDYCSPTFGTPEQILAGLAEVFLQLGRDYAGALPTGHTFSAVVRASEVLYAEAMAKQAEKVARARRSPAARCCLGNQRSLIS